MKKMGIFLRDETGASAVEYALLVALIACVIVVAVTAVGTNLGIMYNKIAGKVSTAKVGMAIAR